MLLLLSFCCRGVARYSSSVYDKNVEEELRPVVVPNHVIASDSDNKYWGPHPKTGIFGRADPSGGGDSAGTGLCRAPLPADGSSTSALDQTAWLRPLEDVEKPPPLS